MAVVLVKSSPLAHPIRKRMALFAILGVNKASMESAQSAGNIAQMASEMMVPSVPNLLLMAVV